MNKLERSTMIKKMVSIYSQTLNKKSKWYNTDLLDYETGLTKVSDSELNRIYNNVYQLNDETSQFNKQVDKEEIKLLKAGMYNIDKMSPKNCLD